MILFLLILSTNALNASEGEGCEGLEPIDVKTELSTSTVDMGGQDYYFQFTTSDSVVFFNVNSTGDMPNELILYYESCDSEPIQISTLFTDSNYVEHLDLISYSIIPNATYYLKVSQNSSNSSNNIVISYQSIPTATALNGNCNEVINGSFERYGSLGNSQNSLDGKISYSAWWFDDQSTNHHGHNADYYNINAGHPDSRIPNNAFGSRTAKDNGNGTDAYAGLFTVLTRGNNFSGQFREWMIGTLRNKLISGRTYKVKYYVSLTNNPLFNQPCVAPGLKFVQNLDPSVNNLAINNMTADIQDLTIQQAGGNWVEISGNYLANGNEKYFIIANFLSDNQSLPPNANGNVKSYFYVDEVSVEEVDCCESDFIIQNGSNINDLRLLLSPTTSYFIKNYHSTVTGTVNSYTEVNGLTLYINGIFNVDDNLVLNNCKLIMGENARLNITKNFWFTGVNEKVIKSCNPNKFWDGIYIYGDLGGTFNTKILPTGSSLSSSTIFENSYNGIVTIGKARGNIERFNFDRNNLAVHMKENAYDLNTEADFTISYSTFNCSNPLINSSGNLYFPQQSIKIEDFTHTISNGVSRVNISYSVFNGKGGQLNIKNSSVSIFENLFQNFNNSYYTPGVSVNETAVKIEGNYGVYANEISFLSNRFNSNSLSVHINKPIRVRFTSLYGTFSDNTVNYDHTLNQPISGVPHSKFLSFFNNDSIIGFPIPSDNIIEVEDVQIYNVETAFQFSNVIRAKIQNNLIDLETQPSSFYTSKNNIYSTGISLNNYGIQQSFLNPTNSYIGNTIKHAKIGISVNFAQVELVNNTIEDLNDLTAAPGSCLPYLPPCPARPAWGIRVNNSEATIIENKVFNNINSYGTVQPSSNLNITGIELINSMLYNQGNTVSGLEGIYCNNVENTGVGIKFSASNYMFTKIHNNKMADNYYGLVLANNGSLDNVGFSGTGGAGHNNFAGPYIGSSTFSSYSNAALCTLYTEGGGGAFDPQILSGDATQGFSYTPFSKDNIGNTVISPGCTTRARIANPNTLANANLSKSGGTNRNGFTPSLRKSPAMVHASDSALMYQKQMAFYRMLKDSAMMSSKQWKPFVDSMKLTPMGRAVGLSSRNAVSTNSSNFDANIMLMNPIVERFEQELELSATDLDHLRLMAIKCPYYDGIAVYQARYVLDALGEGEIVSECELVAAPAKRSAKNRAETNFNQLNTQFSVYPNPTRGEVTIDYLVAENEIVQIEIIDLMGKVQLVKDLNVSSMHTLKLNELTTGIYFYRLIKNDALLHSGKLIIE